MDIEDIKHLNTVLEEIRTHDAAYGGGVEAYGEEKAFTADDNLQRTDTDDIDRHKNRFYVHMEKREAQNVK